MQGIYGFYNKVEKEWWYVGQSIDIDRRLNEHINSKKNDWHEYFRTHLDEFEYKEIELVDNLNKLRKREDHYIDLLKPKYTSKKSNKGSQVGPLSDETKSKIGANNGMKRKEVAAKSSANHKGISRPDIIGENNPMKNPDVVSKVSAKNKGKHHTAESKLKISTNRKGKGAGKNNGMFGRTGSKCPVFGTHWMYNPNSNENPIIVKQCDVEQKKKEGYILGRKKRA